MRNSLKSISIRYSLLLLFSLFGAGLIYPIFLPLTKWPTYWVLKIFYSVEIIGNNIFLSDKIIEIVEACIASSAYLLLLILTLSVQKINIKKRLELIIGSFAAFYIINTLRIIILSIMYFEDSIYFDSLHQFLWYFGSTISVVIIWFFGIYVLNVRCIPFYGDLKFLYKQSIFAKKANKK